MAAILIVSLVRGVGRRAALVYYFVEIFGSSIDFCAIAMAKVRRYFFSLWQSVFVVFDLFTIFASKQWIFKGEMCFFQVFLEV